MISSNKIILLYTIYTIFGLLPISPSWGVYEPFQYRDASNTSRRASARQGSSQNLPFPSPPPFSRPKPMNSNNEIIANEKEEVREGATKIVPNKEFILEKEMGPEKIDFVDIGRLSLTAQGINNAFKEVVDVNKLIRENLIGLALPNLIIGPSGKDCTPEVIKSYKTTRELWANCPGIPSLFDSEAGTFSSRLSENIKNLGKPNPIIPQANNMVIKDINFADPKLTCNGNECEATIAINSMQIDGEIKIDVRSPNGENLKGQHEKNISLMVRPTTQSASTDSNIYSSDYQPQPVEIVPSVKFKFTILPGQIPAKMFAINKESIALDLPPKTIFLTERGSSEKIEIPPQSPQAEASYAKRLQSFLSSLPVKAALMNKSLEEKNAIIDLLTAAGPIAQHLFSQSELSDQLLTADEARVQSAKEQEWTRREHEIEQSFVLSQTEDEFNQLFSLNLIFSKWSSWGSDRDSFSDGELDTRKWKDVFDHGDLQKDQDLRAMTKKIEEEKALANRQLTEIKFFRLLGHIVNHNVLNSPYWSQFIGKQIAAHAGPIIVKNALDNFASLPIFSQNFIGLSALNAQNIIDAPLVAKKYQELQQEIADFEKNHLPNLGSGLANYINAPVLPLLKNIKSYALANTSSTSLEQVQELEKLKAKVRTLCEASVKTTDKNFLNLQSPHRSFRKYIDYAKSFIGSKKSVAQDAMNWRASACKKVLRLLEDTQGGIVANEKEARIIFAVKTVTEASSNSAKTPFNLLFQASILNPSPNCAPAFYNLKFLPPHMVEAVAPIANYDFSQQVGIQAINLTLQQMHDKKFFDFCIDLTSGGTRTCKDGSEDLHVNISRPEIKWRPSLIAGQKGSFYLDVQSLQITLRHLVSMGIPQFSRLKMTLHKNLGVNLSFHPEPCEGGKICLNAKIDGRDQFFANSHMLMVAKVLENVLSLAMETIISQKIIQANERLGEKIINQPYQFSALHLTEGVKIPQLQFSKFDWNRDSIWAYGNFQKTADQ
jgi:hypothetical protein